MSAKDIQSGGLRPLVEWRRAFDTSTIVFAVIMVATGAAVYIFKGQEIFLETIGVEIILLLTFTPKMMLAFFVAALVTALVSRQFIARWLGDQSGMRGLALASGIGAVTPGGPMISFPVVTALSDAGSSRASMIAYLTSWTTLGFQRIMIWEVPLLGIELALVRILVSLPLPIIAALISIRLPLTDREKARRREKALHEADAIAAGSNRSGKDTP